jgi:hypothetical protein
LEVEVLVIDPRREAVQILNCNTGLFEDRTEDVSGYTARGETVVVVFENGREYPHRRERLRILHSPKRVALTAEDRVEVSGDIWDGVTELWRFAAPGGAWARVFYRRQGSEAYRTRPASEVRILASAAQAPGTAEVLRYWRTIVSRLPGDDPTAREHGRLGFIHPESALASYLAGKRITSEKLTAAPIFPFHCNLSQRKAVERALTCSVSVIEGPPGTGKTETILNLIANIIAIQHQTVAVVSYNNAAVDNVREKLDEQGFGHVLANLGKHEKRDRFLAGQATREAQVEAFAARAPELPDPRRLDHLDRRLRRLQDAERAHAERRHELDAHRLELRHFEQHVQREEPPDLAGLPLLRRSAHRILDYLAETEIEPEGSRPGLLRRIRRYLTYGSLSGLDPADTDVVLRLQRAYYDKRITELSKQIERIEGTLRRASFDQLVQEHHQLSVDVLHAHLGARYRERRHTRYEEATYRRSRTFANFIEDYPVLLSTCHSLRGSIASGYLLDYLIIDESSQVDLLTASLALSACRNLVVVGDRRQLPPIQPEPAADLESPRPAYDCRHNLLTSLSELYGEKVPRTLLREHYRCDPAIIGFCNKKFYEGELIPYTTSGAERPMIVVRTVEGNHMRQHHGRGRSNQREVDVIANEVIRDYCSGFADAEIGVTTPYRHQAEKVGDVLDQVEVATVHKFQGRQKPVVIMTTVLDETWRGRTGLGFVDDPQLINVAVSRAIRRFILVTNHDMLPTSRHIRDLVGYIRYHNLDEEVVDSAVISMFDLLYSKYSSRLRRLAGRLRNEMRYRSEDIIWTALHDILTEQRYAHLTVSHHVLMRNLLPDVSRLTPRQATFVAKRASVDFVVYNRVTNHPLLAIEVDGFAFHENNPVQRERDAVKDEILRAHEMPLLRLPTTGSGENERIRRSLHDAEAHWARLGR